MVPQAMTVFEQQDGIGVEAVEAVTRRIDPLRIVAAGEKKPVLEQRHFVDAAQLEGQCQQQQVKIAIHQLLVDALRLVLVQIKFQIRVGLAQLRQDTRQKKRRNSRNNAEPQAARERCAALSGNLHQVLELAQADARLRGHLPAHGRDRDLPVRAIDELRTQHRLQVLYRGAESGLRDETICGRFAEMGVILERCEIA